MKTLSFSMLLSSLIMITAIGCDKNITGSTPDENIGQYLNNIGQDDGLILASINEIAADSVSVEEINGLVYMREEEKLARDVYAILYEKWNLRPFSNITRSEQMHMDAVLTLLNRYSILDPVDSKGVGVFKNEALQNLYNALITEGNKSIADALKVGATIEEVDIVDLKKHLNETDNQDITFVYENLMRGSRNHLRAFVKNLKTQGVTYVPQFLSAAEYEQIISGSMERGRKHGSN